MLKYILVYAVNNNVIALLLIGWSQLYMHMYAICLNASIHMEFCIDFGLCLYYIYIIHNLMSLVRVCYVFGNGLLIFVCHTHCK